MSIKKPVNLTLNTRVIELAERTMELRGHSSMSGFVEELIRDEYEKRLGLMTFQPSDTTSEIEATVSKIVDDATKTPATRKRRTQGGGRSSKRPPPKTS